MSLLIIAGCGAARLPEVEPTPAPATPQPLVSKPPPSSTSGETLPVLRSPAGDSKAKTGPTGDSKAKTGPAGDSKAKTGPTGDELSEKLADNLQELQQVLKVVKDEATASRVRPRVKSLLQRQKELRRQIVRLAETLSPQEDMQLQHRYHGQIESAVQRVLAELQRIKSVPGGGAAIAPLAAPLDHPQ